MTNTIGDLLRVHTKTDYGSEYRSHCLEIYKLYVEQASAISNRRQAANSFFLTVNTAIIGVAGYMSVSDDGIKLALAAAGILLCFYWYRLILSYKQLNSGKFKVVHEIEKELPLSPYDAEWESLGRGKKPKLYRPFTSVEMAIPWVFLLFHAVVIAFSYWSSIQDHLNAVIDNIW